MELAMAYGGLASAPRECEISYALQGSDKVSQVRGRGRSLLTCEISRINVSKKCNLMKRQHVVIM